jgi:hypothetical protein
MSNMLLQASDSNLRLALNSSENIRGLSLRDVLSNHSRCLKSFQIPARH